MFTNNEERYILLSMNNHINSSDLELKNGLKVEFAIPLSSS